MSAATIGWTYRSGANIEVLGTFCCLESPENHLDSLASFPKNVFGIVCVVGSVTRLVAEGRDCPEGELAECWGR
jgi:hypothetical protein